MNDCFSWWIIYASLIFTYRVTDVLCRLHNYEKNLVFYYDRIDEACNSLTSFNALMVDLIQNNSIKLNNKYKQ